MHHDGNGWVTCDQGHQHWGLFGAAGLLASTPAGPDQLVLLQLRAPMSHHGGTWGLPGGARDSHETAVDAAFREAREESSLETSELLVTHEHVDDHGGWAYTTVVALAQQAQTVEPRAESDDVRWVAVDDVTRLPLTLPLHPGFAASWPEVRPLLRAH